MFVCVSCYRVILCHGGGGQREMFLVIIDVGVYAFVRIKEISPESRYL